VEKPLESTILPIVEFAVPGLGGPSAPGSIAAGPDGNVWFSIHSAQLGTARITTSGTITPFVLPATVGAVDPVVTGSDEPVSRRSGRRRHRPVAADRSAVFRTIDEIRRQRPYAMVSTRS
jgi:hypothetical protein